MEEIGVEVNSAKVVSKMLEVLCKSSLFESRPSNPINSLTTLHKEVAVSLFSPSLFCVNPSIETKICFWLWPVKVIVHGRHS